MYGRMWPIWKEAIAAVWGAVVNSHAVFFIVLIISLLTSLVFKLLTGCISLGLLSQHEQALALGLTGLTQSWQMGRKKLTNQAKI